MKKLLLILLFVPLTSFTNIYSQGLNFSSQEDIESLPVFESNTFGFTENLPSTYSLEEYVPPVLNQGTSGTCVGYALGYYAISTMHNIKFKRTFWAEKVIHSFDPLYAYSLAGFSQQSDCDSGLKMLDAMKVFAEYGNKKFFFKPNKSCEDSISSDEYDNSSQYLIPYALESFSFIQSYNRNYIDNVKRSIYNGQPVIVGMSLTDSFDALYSKSSDSSNSNDLWSPSDSEELTGGHAVCVIGFDDTKYGGSFRVVNSWGRDYGDNGYFWITYDDLQNHANETYNITPAFLDDMDFESATNFTNNYVYYINDKKNYIYEGLLDENNYSSGYGIESWINEDEGYWNYSVGLYLNNKREGIHVTINKDGDLKEYEFDQGELIRSLGFSSNQSKAVDIDYINSIIPEIKLKQTFQSDIDSFKMKSVGRWNMRKQKK